jgi:hypothetical protein
MEISTLLSRGRELAELDSLVWWRCCCGSVVAISCEESHDADAYASPYVIALAGFCIQADAQDRCPELTRLRSEAAEALKQTTTVPASERCESYNRFSAAWGEIAQYANDHRELCDISILSMSEFEKYHREAVKARDDVCSGRPVRAFPPDLIQR